jgi:hypothetical protein
MQKKRQHFVPKVYLQPFIDRAPPKGFKPGQPFTPTVWVIKAGTMSLPQRKAPSSILWGNKIYTLDSDDPARPVVEESLSRLESAYRIVRDQVLRSSHLTPQQYATLLFFIGALHSRVPPEIQSFQNHVDNLIAISKQISELPPEGMAWTDFDQSGVKAIADRALAYARVIGQRGFILVNQTEMQFITSDSPVTHQTLHVDDVPIKCFDPCLLARVPVSARAFFSFVPIGPDKAFVSSLLLCAGSDLYVSSCSKELIFALNECTRLSAGAVIVHNVSKPYGQFAEILISREADLAAASNPKTGLMVYTACAREWINTHQFSHKDGIHPLHGVIRFKSVSLAELKLIACAEEVVEVLIYKDGHLVGIMRDCWLAATALGNEVESIIENFPGGWTVWRDFDAASKFG